MTYKKHQRTGMQHSCYVTCGDGASNANCQADNLHICSLFSEYCQYGQYWTLNFAI